MDISWFLKRSWEILSYCWGLKAYKRQLANLIEIKPIKSVQIRGVFSLKLLVENLGFSVKKFFSETESKSKFLLNFS